VISVVDASKNEVAETFRVTVGNGGSIAGMALSQDGSRLYVSVNNVNGSEVTVFETADHSFDDSFDIESGWSAGDLVISPDGSLAYVDIQKGSAGAIQVIAI